MNQETMTMRIFVASDNDPQSNVPFNLTFQKSRFEQVCDTISLLVNAGDVYLAEEMGEWTIVR
jgi:hypothetical protein